MSLTTTPNGIDSLSQSAQDYALVAQAIRYIESHRREQPELVAIAGHVGLSEFHFQRLFSRWAGVSPKRFLQALTVEEARRALTRSASVLDAAYDTGLSGPGRLHDLFVQCQAATPGEVKSGGAGLTIRYAIQPTPFGDALIGVTERGICALSFVADGEESSAVDELRRRWPAARLVADRAESAAIAQRIFSGATQRDEPLHLYIKGTNFQMQVWQALLRVPTGSLTTYGDLARTIGRPSAARAVGSAVSSNVIAWLIPCHRVIRQTGVVEGYRWGSERKRAMLGWEAAQAA
ncbi:MAG: methylated-DNA--[protein]-cysteine S-methyltransferase [Chloroflexi bacterium]|nr:methylated-DNA--[protein]-cysteine S-methyltransferase [Chloroflexota bacterium]